MSNSMKDTDSLLVPRHLGIILDGNRRWAKEQGLPTNEGHAKGADTIEPVVRAAFEQGVQYVSLFLFSTENWKRTQEEVGYLMKLFIHYFKKDSKRLIKDGFKILFAGRINDQVRADIRRAIAELEEESRNGDKGTVIFNFNYGGQTELVDCARSLIGAGYKPEDIDESVLAQHLYKPEVPELDMVIRTSGEQRLSGFQLWRVAYAELYFVDKHWPDFTKADIIKAINEYTRRNRRFGG